jgi:protein-S-isoprenylcysteine O-methyltransferase Ste14
MQRGHLPLSLCRKRIKVVQEEPSPPGGTLLFVGAPLLLGSIYGLAVGILLVVILIVRSIGEEEMLKDELEGYDEYMKKVRWRLIPLVFNGCRR